MNPKLVVGNWKMNGRLEANRCLVEALLPSMPDGVAVASRSDEVSYGELFERVDQVAAGFSSAGIEAGDAVAVWLPNSLEWVLSYLAAVRMGATFVPIHPGFKPDEVDAIVADCEAAALICDPPRAAAAEPIFMERLHLRRAFCTGEADFDQLDPFDDLLESRDPLPPASHDPAHIAGRVYTSTSIESPRCTWLSRQNYAASAEAIVQALALGEAHQVLVGLPLSHTGSMVVGLLAPLLAGSTVLLADPLQRAQVMGRLRDEPVTHLVAGPQLVAQLVDSGLQAAAVDRLEAAVVVGAPVGRELQRRFAQRVAARLVQIYGLSEAAGVCTVNAPVSQPIVAGAAGLPVGDVEVRVVDDQGRDRARGDVGEVCVRGSNVSQLACGQRRSTEVDPKWLATGDLGYLDEQGYLFVAGRAKNMVVRGGEHVYPREVEEVLERHPAVARAAVVGVPDPQQGEEILAFLVVHDDHAIRADEVLSYCREHLADFKCPSSVEYREALPQTPTGQVHKDLLVRAWAGGLA